MGQFHGEGIQVSTNTSIRRDLLDLRKLAPTVYIVGRNEDAKAQAVDYIHQLKSERRVARWHIRVSSPPPMPLVRHTFLGM